MPILFIICSLIVGLGPALILKFYFVAMTYQHWITRRPCSLPLNDLEGGPNFQGQESEFVCLISD